jgi:hypothetical protein
VLNRIAGNGERLTARFTTAIPRPARKRCASPIARWRGRSFVYYSLRDSFPYAAPPCFGDWLALCPTACCAEYLRCAGVLRRGKIVRFCLLASVMRRPALYSSLWAGLRLTLHHSRTIHRAPCAASVSSMNVSCHFCGYGGLGRGPKGRGSHRADPQHVSPEKSSAPLSERYGEPHSAADDSPNPSEADHGPGPSSHARKELRLDQHTAASGEQITGWLACGFR